MSVRCELEGMKILVTGATGFLGSHLCRALRITNNQVHAVSRRPHRGTEGLHWWQGDLADYAATRRLLTEIQPDVIFQLTTHGWGAPDPEHVLPTLRSDLMATVNVLAVATELKVRRIVVTGSLEEPQGDGPDDCVPASPYAAAKCAVGLYARMFHRLYGTPVVIARVFMTYGPGQPARKLIPYVILMLLRQESPKLSDGRRLVDWIYVDDVIEGLMAVAQAQHVDGRTVDLGSGRLVSIRQVVEQLEGLVGATVRPVFGELPERAMESIRAADTTGIYDTLGWRASTPLEQGLALTTEWYRAESARGEGGCLPEPTGLSNQASASNGFQKVEPTL